MIGGRRKNPADPTPSHAARCFQRTIPAAFTSLREDHARSSARIRFPETNPLPEHRNFFLPWRGIFNAIAVTMKSDDAVIVTNTARSHWRLSVRAGVKDGRIMFNDELPRHGKDDSTGPQNQPLPGRC